MWDLIVSVPDHCLSFYFVSCSCRSIVIHIISYCLYREITSVSSLHISGLDVFFLHQPGPGTWSPCQTDSQLQESDKGNAETFYWE